VDHEGGSGPDGRYIAVGGPVSRGCVSGTTMDLDRVTLEVGTREEVRVALNEFPLLGSNQERVSAAHRL
jgi:hypothetical protein